MKVMVGQDDFLCIYVTRKTDRGWYDEEFAIEIPESLVRDFKEAEARYLKLSKQIKEYYDARG